MRGSRLAALLILALAGWLSIEAWWLVSPVLETGWGRWAARRIYLGIAILFGIAVWLWRR